MGRVVTLILPIFAYLHKLVKFSDRHLEASPSSPAAFKLW